MSEELKACPFCGTLPQANSWIFRGINETRYFCPNQECPLSVRTVTLEEWQSRPLEDALRARAERAEKMVERLIEAGERLRDYAILVSADHPMGDGQMALKDKSMWDALKTEWQKESETC